jgi:hypothetical protein
VRGIDPHIVEGVCRRDYPLEIILPNYPVIRRSNSTNFGGSRS